MRWTCVMFGCVMLAAVSPAAADAPAAAKTPLPPGFDPQRHMLVSEVKEGMEGYGVSVFKGTKLERFDVKVLSVLHNFNPKYDEFQPRTLWSLSNAFTSAFKELEPIPQFRATTKFAGFLERAAF